MWNHSNSISIVVIVVTYRLKALDIVTLREISKRANVIPVISKADTISKDDLARFKQKVFFECFKYIN